MRGYAENGVAVAYIVRLAEPGALLPTSALWDVKALADGSVLQSQARDCQV